MSNFSRNNASKQGGRSETKALSQLDHVIVSNLFMSGKRNGMAFRSFSAKIYTIGREKKSISY